MNTTHTAENHQHMSELESIKQQQHRKELVKDLNAAKRDLRRAKAHVAEIEAVIANLDENQ